MLLRHPATGLSILQGYLSPAATLSSFRHRIAPRNTCCPSHMPMWGVAIWSNVTVLYCLYCSLLVIPTADSDTSVVGRSLGILSDVSMQACPEVGAVELWITETLPHVFRIPSVAVVVKCSPRSLLSNFFRRFSCKARQMPPRALHTHFIHLFIHLNTVFGIAPLVLQIRHKVSPVLRNCQMRRNNSRHPLSIIVDVALRLIIN